VGQSNTEAPVEDISADGRLILPHFLSSSSVVLGTAALRTWLRSLMACRDHSAALIRLGWDSTCGSPPAPMSPQLLRDEMLALMHEVAGISWHEARRALDEVDLRTRGDRAASGPPTRPYRIKL
jgi:hypothetical protein